MTIGILYESKEWSTYALRDRIAEVGVPVKLFDLQERLDPDELLSCGLIVNRIFASAVFRGHQKSLDQMPAVLELLEKHGVPLINPAEAHYYETSKTRAKEALAAHGFSVPKLYGSFYPAQWTKGDVNTEGTVLFMFKNTKGTVPSVSDVLQTQGTSPFVFEYPCIVKPDCGGRTTHTFIVHDRQELSDAMKDAPGVCFIAEEYILPEKGYVTRLEIIGGEIRLALKRGVAANGLSAYHLGSEYDFYEDLPDEIADTAIRATELLSIEAGSMDIIENDTGFYIIDANSVSNASEDNTEMFNFDLMKETAAYAVKRYNTVVILQ